MTPEEQRLYEIYSAWAGQLCRLPVSSITRPPNSVAFKEAAAELARIAKECHQLALKTGDQTLIAETEKSFAYWSPGPVDLRGNCLAEDANS